MFMNICDLCKTQEMCNKVVEEDTMILKLFRNQAKTQEMHERALKRSFFAFSYVSDEYKTKQICKSVVLKDPENL